ncbi:hypothetical protein NPIL_428271 [Nephila pilipes]|uniref:Mos1 transposase HTH domain-containing protein n=1 Tax=Nephila pilipes TaxID=299642 RepID=A0A8X6U616_NEPPI|nr:hypothetical protein NPIL_428271 [Nephila pilipes]
MELNREHFRAIIFHNFRRGLSRQECFDELNSLYSDKAPSYSTVKNWYNEFNRGRCSIQDESRAGRPKSVVVPEKINAVRELIKQDRHVTYREIEASLDISMTSINKILHEHLSVKKICSRWIPHNLTNAQKKARVDWCKEMLEKYIQGTSRLCITSTQVTNHGSMHMSRKQNSNQLYGSSKMRQNQQKLFEEEAHRNK